MMLRLAAITLSLASFACAQGPVRFELKQFEKEHSGAAQGAPLLSDILGWGSRAELESVAEAEFRRDHKLPPSDSFAGEFGAR